MRFLKALIGAVIGLVVLLIVALFLMPTERIAAIAAQQFESATGRALTIAGPIAPSFYPVIGASARDVAIGNPDWVGEGAMLRAAEMDIGLDLRALIRGDIQIERVVLQSPELDLRRDAQGRVNWDFGTAAPAQAARAAPDPPAEGSSAITAAPARQFSLREARILNGRLRFSDAQSGTALDLESVDATLGLPDLAGPADLTLAARLAGQPLTLTAQIAEAGAFLDGAVTPLTLDLTAAGSEMRFSGRAGLSDLVFDGRAQASIPALVPLMRMAGQTGGALPPEYLPLGFTGQITRTADGTLFAREADIRAGQIRARGGADLRPGAERPFLSGQFSADMLDLRSAAGTTGSGGGSGGGQGGAAAAGWSRAPIDASALGLLDADLTFRLAGLRTDLTTLGPSRIGLRIDRARAVFDLQEIALFGGQLTGEFVANNRAGLSVGGTLRARAIDLLPLLTEFADFRRLQGAAEADLQFLGVGDSVHAIMNSLRGEGALRFSQGEILGFDLAGMLRNLDLSYMGEGNRTIYDAIAGNFTISDGVLSNNDLRLEASRIAVTGQGRVNLGARTLDYRLTPAALGDTNLRVPLMITGPWAEPRFRLDLEALAREQLRLDQERLEQLAREEARRLEERARTSAERRLLEGFGIEGSGDELIDSLMQRGIEREIRGRLRGLLGGN